MENWTLRDVAEKHLSYMENSRRFSQNTIRLRKIYLAKFLEYADENFSGTFAEITNMMVDEYFANYANSPSARGGKVSLQTVNVMIRSVKAMFNWAKNYADISCKIHPAELREYKVPDKHPDIIVHSEVAKVVKNWRNLQDCLMIATDFEAGLRIEELMKMKIEDLRGQTLDVVGKGEKHRITFISRELADDLADYWKSQGWKSGFAFRPQQHVSDSESGYSNDETIRARIKTAFREILGIKMHPHQLRHAFALNLLENGCNIVSIQKMLGHAKVETTMKYLNITDKFLEKDYIANFGGTVASSVSCGKLS